MPAGARFAFQAGALAAVYVLTGELGLSLAFANENVTTVWPPTGIALAAFVLWGGRLWPGVWVGALVANLLNGASAEAALGISVGNTLAPLLGAILLRRVGFRSSLERPADIVALMFGGGVVAMLVSATGGTVTLAAAGAIGEWGFAHTWLEWWVGDLMGVVLVAPLVLTFATSRPNPLRQRPFEAATLIAATLLGGWLVFISALPLDYVAPLFFVLVPAVAAVRFQQPGAAIVVFIVAGLALVTVITGQAETQQPLTARLIAVQIFNAGLAMTVLTLAAVMRQRLCAEARLRGAAVELEDRVKQRTLLLQESQRLARIGSFRWDAVTDVNTWSDELYRIYGMTLQEEAPSFERYMSKVHPDSREDVQRAVERTVQTHEPFEHEYRIVHPSGEERWVHAYGEVVTDSNGRLTGLQGTCQDITERKMAEGAVRASEERSRTLIEFAHDAFVSIDGSGLITGWNAAAESMFGWSRSEALGRKLAETIIPPSYRQAHTEGFERFLETGHGPILNQTLELTAVHQSGREFPVELAVWPVLGGDTYTFYSFIRDITGRKNAETALRASEERFRALIESAPDAFIVVDAKGRIVLVNDQAKSLFGYESDELIGQRVERLVPEGLKQRHSSHRAGYMTVPRRRKMGSGLELWATRKDGTRVPVDISLSPVSTDEGVLVVAGVRDVTVQRQAEETLRTAYERERDAADNLRALDEAKTVFLEAVSHELRTPLTVIVGVAALLQMGELKVDDEQFPELLRSLDSSAHRLQSLLDDLLDLDRLRRGIIKPSRRPTRVADLMAQVVHTLDLGNHPVHLDAHEVVANVDPAQTERIIENLVSNALKHTPPETPVWVRAEPADGGVLIVVEDAGQGVPANIRDKLFDPFVKDTRTHITGTGIGLSLVDRFSKLHGGRAWVEERPGGGALFRVFLPENGDEAAEAASSETAA